MKSKKRGIISLLLCLCMAFCMLSPVASAQSNAAYASVEVSNKATDAFGTAISKLLNYLVNDVILGFISRLLPNMDFIGKAGADEVLTAFYEGNEEFISNYSEKYVWRVGYGSCSILPDDFGKKYKYARGSYMPWGYATEMYTDDDGNKEDLKVRTVILDDMTGRGLTVIASVDCIGISNSDVMKIREALSDFSKEHNIVSLNVSAIHSHMSIDSQGVWNSPLVTVAGNFAAEYTGLTEHRHGVNEDYLNCLIERTKQSVLNAYEDMKEGTLTYTDIELNDWFRTRTAASELDENIHKLMFEPLDDSRPTLIASFGAHPEISSYDAEFDTRLSSDFVYYMEKLINSAGANFIYIQGNVGTNSVLRDKSTDGLDLADNHESAIRVGYELAYITLCASNTYEERVRINNKLGDKLGVNMYAGSEGYTVWYDELDTFEAVPVEAVLNIRHRQVRLETDNSVALILIKLGLASSYLSYDSESKTYYTLTEIGYMELGSALKVFFSPGEMYSELLVGGYGLRNSDYKSLRDEYGANVILFDLMNDAAGYICPDETYSVVGFKYNPESDELEGDTWCLAVSVGESAASTLMQEYKSLVESTKG